jgi:uncharacterized LabA/DUF88 family protein
MVEGRISVAMDGLMDSAVTSAIEKVSEADVDSLLDGTGPKFRQELRRMVDRAVVKRMKQPPVFQEPET